ncbi:MAG: SRPBCC family protein, partial [Microthrixaceae bacterium]|nr:SRPBCC family protein [Microthrixaceae bacterium]
MTTPNATRVTRWALRPIEEVFDTISDPGTYPRWLVGCRTIRSIDDHWPSEGSRFHHRVGLIGPLTVPDSSEVLEVER